MTETTGFMLYHDDAERLEQLSDADLARIMRAAIRFARDGEEPQLDALSSMAFAPIKEKIVRDAKKYCQRKAAGERNGTRTEREPNESGTRTEREPNESGTRTERNGTRTERTRVTSNKYQVTSNKYQVTSNEYQVTSNEYPVLTDGESTAATPPTRARGADAPAAPSKPKKKSEAEKIDEAVKTYAESYGDDDTRTLLSDWLKVRKAKRAPNTLRAIQLNLDKLDRTALESGLNINDYLREVIRLGWAAFYEIKDKGGGYKAPPRSQPQSTADFYLDMLREERAKENDDG